MPLYEYLCSEGHYHTELKKVDERETDKCPVCGKKAKQVIATAPALDWNMGVDLDFPTAADRWNKIQWQKNRGEMWDSNNNRYGGEYEKKKKG